MKKGLLLLVVLFLSVSLFADDAMVLPSGVLRATFANSLITTGAVYESDGDVESKDNLYDATLNNLGAAIEFGITDTLTAAVQWAPGTFVYSDIELGGDAEGMSDYEDDISYAGLNDLFVGAKYQMLDSDMFRAALALGTKIPLDSYDSEAEIDNFLAGDSFRLSSQSTTDTFGLGGRAYFDVKLHKNFYINFYNQTIYYLAGKKDNPDDALNYIGTFAYFKSLGASDAAAEAGADANAPVTGEQDYEYGVYLDFEIEPHFNMDLSQTAEIGLGVPVKYSWAPDMVVEDETVSNSGNYVYSIAPALSFFYKGGFPFELTAQYDWSLSGINTIKKNVFIVKLKLFYDFY